MAVQKKYYVVWAGRKPGIYETWNDCNQQIMGFPKAEYKSFTSKEQAVEAFNGNSKKYIYAATATKKNIPVGNFIKDSIAVDGAWNTATGFIEYKGVYIPTGEVLFLKGPYADGTNNIAEFLAIVHALAYCKKHNLQQPVYSDSRNAIGWVKAKLAKTNHAKSEANKELFELIARAEQWLKTNTYTTSILKWETQTWGENPADFGRK